MNTSDNNDDKNSSICDNNLIINNVLVFIFNKNNYLNYNAYFLYEFEKIMYSSNEDYNDNIRDYILLIYNKIKEFINNDENSVEVYKKYVKYYLKLIFRENKNKGIIISNIIMKTY
jgi:hypothetical protein